LLLNHGHHVHMRAYSEDLRRKIVEAVQRGMGQSEAARSFGVSLSSVKRYVGALRDYQIIVAHTLSFREFRNSTARSHVTKHVWGLHR
jgi:transposase